METEIPQENENEDPSDADSHWDNRILCSDGNCIGVIGADRRCKECGKLYKGPLPETIAVVDAEERIADENQEMPAEAIENNTMEESPGDMEESPGDMEESPEDMEESPGDDDWENRVLCSDGNCIGVIGSDGKCKECGKPYEMTNDD
jgi:hypothetical protein